MRSNFINSFGKKLAVLFFSIGIISSALYAPSLASRAKAQFIVEDPANLTINIKNLVFSIINGVAQKIAQRMVDQITKSTITWANNGFNGNPAYVTDPKQYFTNIANGAIGDAINASPIGFLCSPFQAQIKVALVKYYTQPLQTQCTLNQIGVNLDNFYQNFNQGGWNAWIKMTQEDQNNPYGAFFSVQTNTSSRLATAVGIAQNQQIMNSGFLDFKKCTLRNPPVGPDLAQRYFNGDRTAIDAIEENYPEWDPSKPTGACLTETTVTPGDTIKTALNNVLPNGLNKLINVQTINELVGAFASGLLSRYVFGPQGLFGNNFANHFSASSNANIGNGNQGLNWEFCAKEGEFCSFKGVQDVRFAGDQVGPLGIVIKTSFYEANPNGGIACTFQAFENAHAIGDAGNAIPTDQDAEKTFHSTVKPGSIRCEIQTINDTPAPPPPPPGAPVPTLLECSANKKDAIPGEDVTWTINSGYPAGSTYTWTGDEIPETGITKTTPSLTMKYAGSGEESMRVTLLDSSGAPVRAVDCDDTVLVSPLQDTGDTNGSASTSTGGTNSGTGGTGTGTGGGTTLAPQLACDPSTNNARVGQSVQWTLDSTYPSSTIYSWSGDESGSALAQPSSNRVAQVTYTSSGTKSMSVTAYNSDGSQSAPQFCNSTVAVSP